MSDSQSDRFFSMLEHAIVPVRATELNEVETDVNARYVSYTRNLIGGKHTISTLVHQNQNSCRVWTAFDSCYQPGYFSEINP